jgi:Ca2+:H+ antiporter
MYLFFQLSSHTFLFEEKDTEKGKGGVEQAQEGQVQEGQRAGDQVQEGQRVEDQVQEEEEEEEHILSPWAAGVALVVVTIVVAVCAEYLVGSIDSIVETAHISKTFIGLILLPIVGNAAEHVTAVVVAWKGKMDLAMGVAIGSSMQIALSVTPFLVILGWIMDKPMTLHFETFETVVFFLSGSNSSL